MNSNISPNERLFVEMLDKALKLASIETEDYPIHQFKTSNELMENMNNEKTND